MSVSTTPGATQFTVMPEGATSLASALVRPMTPALAAEYATSQEAPTCPHMEERVTMRPSFRWSMGGRAA